VPSRSPIPLRLEALLGGLRWHRRSIDPWHVLTNAGNRPHRFYCAGAVADAVSAPTSGVAPMTNVAVSRCTVGSPSRGWFESGPLRVCGAGNEHKRRRRWSPGRSRIPKHEKAIAHERALGLGGGRTPRRAGIPGRSGRSRYFRHRRAGCAGRGGGARLDARDGDPNPFGGLSCSYSQTAPASSRARRKQIDRGIQQGLSFKHRG